MKQRMVIMVSIMVSMACEKCRSKAMELAARTTGVISINITSDHTNRLEVIGEGVDLVCLIKCLRKKVGHAVIQEVEEVKDKKQEEKKAEANKDEEKKPSMAAHSISQCCPGCYNHHCPPVPQLVVYDEPGTCTIM